MLKLSGWDTVQGPAVLGENDGKYEVKSPISAVQTQQLPGKDVSKMLHASIIVCRHLTSSDAPRMDAEGNFN